MGTYRTGPSEMICRDCGTEQMKPRRNVPVLIAEVVAALLVTFFIPFGFVVVLIVAIIGSVATRVPRCSRCGHRSLIPSETPEGMRILKGVTRLVVLAVAIGCAAAADLKPDEQLPWCRVTINLGAEGEPQNIRVSDGWWDAQTRLLIPLVAIDGKGSFGPAPFDADEIVKVEQAPKSPALPDKARAMANRTRATVAKEQAEKAAQAAKR